MKPELSLLFLPLICFAMALLLVLTFYLPALYSGSIYLCVAKVKRGESLPSVSVLFREVHPFVGRLIGLSFILGIVIGTPLLLLIGLLTILTGSSSPIDLELAIGLLLIPISFFSVPLIAFAQIALINEGRSFNNAMRRSWEILKSNFWAILNMLLFLGVVQFVVSWTARYFISVMEEMWLGAAISPTITSFGPPATTFFGQLLEVIVSGITDFFYVILITFYYFELTNSSAKELGSEPALEG